MLLMNSSARVLISTKFHWRSLTHKFFNTNQPIYQSTNLSPTLWLLHTFFKHSSFAAIWKCILPGARYKSPNKCTLTGILHVTITTWKLYKGGLLMWDVKMPSTTSRQWYLNEQKTCVLAGYFETLKLPMCILLYVVR